MAAVTPVNEARSQSSEELDESDKKSPLVAVKEGFGGLHKIGYERDRS